MNPEPEKSQEDTPFNMAMLYYVGVSALLDKAASVRIEGNLPIWCTILNVIYNRICFKLNETEEKDMGDLLDKIKKNLTPSPGRSSIGSQVDMMNFSDAAGDMDQLERMIIKVMNKYNMIFPNVKTQQGLKTLREKYNLQGDSK